VDWDSEPTIPGGGEMGSGGGADMIRDELWEWEREGKRIKRRKKRWQ
jgi:hypothetical protein